MLITGGVKTLIKYWSMQDEKELNLASSKVSPSHQGEKLMSEIVTQGD